MRADGASAPERILAEADVAAHDFSPDGTRLIYTRRAAPFGIWSVPIDLSDPEHPKAGSPERFLETPDDVSPVALSPDGRWLAYSATVAARPQIFIRAFPGPGGTWQVTSTGGSAPVWSKDT